MNNTKTLEQKAAQNIEGIVREVFTYGKSEKEQAVVVYDTNSTLSRILYEAYKRALPNATFINFDKTEPSKILKTLSLLNEYDFVALIQSKNFRLDAFRIRVELFKRKIKVIEHPHLERMSDDEVPCFIDALAYDSTYYRTVGPALKVKIDAASSAVLDSGGELLYYDCPFEPAKLNIGDYSEMPNTGGQFPIGEVFTEAKDLEALHGRVNIFIFSDTSYQINRPEKPITLIIKKGVVIDTENSTEKFDEILDLIREKEEKVWVRELGFGLNRAFTKTDTVKDTGTYERMCGVHISLGRKHGMYGKPGFKRGAGWFHVDVFVDTKTFTLDNEVIFENEAWVV
ncbi:FIG00715337: hypothetical protein [hydrothermal vent metagenome]|uniref:Leucyl aminopeptidase (Aminopeptidase T) n=1 Tax=hydrothermal vent metagenome TaxID=652676 RepID=A0A1W1ECL6_9ZZZZ